MLLLSVLLASVICGASSQMRATGISTAAICPSVEASEQLVLKQLGLVCAAPSHAAAGGTSQASLLQGDCQSVNESVSRIWPVAAAKAALTAANAGLRRPNTAPSGYPLSTAATGMWTTTNVDQWTAGFLPAVLWQMAALARNQAPGNASDYVALGNRAAADLGTGVMSLNGTHDVGFLVYVPYRAAVAAGADTGALQSLVLSAAAQRFLRYQPNLGAYGGFPTGSSPRSSVATTIIDDMVNLQLMFGAANMTGNCAYFEAAMNHSRSMVAGHVATNGTVHQEVLWSLTRRQPVAVLQDQGATTSSDWSRGHAWAMYGYTAVQRYLRGGSACAEQYNAANPGVVDSLLALAVNVSESFLQMLPTQLQVPPWDFSDQSLALADRDSSAASAAASALIELDGFAPGHSFASRAVRLISDLSQPAFLSPLQGGSHAILQHGTLFRLHGSYDTGLIFGDYYLLEAVCRAVNSCSSARAAVSPPHGKPPAMPPTSSSATSSLGPTPVVIIDVPGAGPLRLYGRKA